MARDEAPPFARGNTFYNGDTIDTNNLGGVNYEGKEYVFEVNAADTPTASQTDTSGRAVRVRVVRNRSGANLKPARVVHYRAADPYETQVDGYCYALGDRPAGVVDEFLPTAGVPDYDLFYIVVDGPTKFTQPASASSVSLGDRVVPTTGTSATNDDAGRVIKQDISGATSTLANNVQNVVGYAGATNSTNNAQYAGIVHRAFR